MSSNATGIQTNEWLQEVKDEIFDNDKIIQPKVARVIFENTFRPVKWGMNDEDLPYKWFDDGSYELSNGEAYWEPSDVAIDDFGYDDKENVVMGKIATGYDMEKDPADNSDSILNFLKDTVLGKPKKFSPSMDTISEQRINQRANDTINPVVCRV